MRYNNPYMRKEAAAPAASPVATRPELIDYRNKLKDTNRRISDLEQRLNSGNVDRYTYEDRSRMLNDRRTKLLAGYANARKNSQQPATPAQPKQPQVLSTPKQQTPSNDMSKQPIPTGAGVTPADNPNNPESFNNENGVYGINATGAQGAQSALGNTGKTDADAKDMGVPVNQEGAAASAETPDTLPAQQQQEQPAEEVSVDPAVAIAATKQELTDKGYTVGDDNTVYNKDGIAIGTIDDTGAFTGPNGEGLEFIADAEKAGVAYHKEQQRQKAAEIAAKNPKYNTDIKAWYTDFNFEDPSSWIPRLLAGLLGATLGGVLSKNPLGAVLGGVAGWGLGGGAASNWDTLFSTEEQRTQKAAATAEQQAKKQDFDHKVKLTVQTIKVSGDPNIDIEAHKQIRQRLEDMEKAVKLAEVRGERAPLLQNKYKAMQQRYKQWLTQMQNLYGKNF